MPTDLLAFAVALVASASLTAPIRQLAIHVGMVDLPGPRKVHQTPIPMLGGLAIYCAVVLALLVSMDGSVRTQVIGVLAGASLVVLVGILDDRGLLHHQIKLFGAMPAAAVILMASGIRAGVFSTLLPGTVGEVLDLFLTLFWVVGITAAFSILDHMDGLCAGAAAMAAAFFTLFATWSGQILVSTLGAAVFGAAVGFLAWNFNPAKIFMGDGGAMFLGFLMATLGLKLRFAGEPHIIGWLIPAFILAVPVFDTTLISISRLRRGMIPFTSPGKDHAAHRLANLGLGQRWAVVALYGLGGLGGTVAVGMSRLSERGGLLLAAGAVLAALVAVGALERAPYERQDPPRPHPCTPPL